MDNFRYKNRYRIPSSRLKSWNYSSAGWYYVTICTQDRICYFGNITNRKTNLSTIGNITKQFWKEIPKHFNKVLLDEYTIMPNHVHGIIIINRRDVINHVSTKKNISQMGSGTLGEIVRWYKGRTTYEIHKNNQKFFWQSRFYDHIIRDEQSLSRIREYIRNNHLNWDTDEENPKNIKSGL